MNYFQPYIPSINVSNLSLLNRYFNRKSSEELHRNSISSDHYGYSSAMPTTQGLTILIRFVFYWKFLSVSFFSIDTALCNRLPTGCFLITTINFFKPRVKCYLILHILTICTITSSFDISKTVTLYLEFSSALYLMSIKVKHLYTCFDHKSHVFF